MKSITKLHGRAEGVHFEARHGWDAGGGYLPQGPGSARRRISIGRRSTMSGLLPTEDAAAKAARGRGREAEEDCG